MSSPQLSASFRGSGARDSYIRGARQGCAPKDASYDVPGMAESIQKSPSGSYAFKPGKSDRDSYIKANLKGKTGADSPNYNVPGMAELSLKNAQRANSKAAFGSTGARDSYIKTPKKGNATDASYSVPGMADAIANSRSGTYAFKSGSSDRDSYIKAERRGKTDPPASSTPKKEDFRAKTPTRSTTPTSAFRGSGNRDSYIKGARKGSGPDASYNLPGMADNVAKSPHGRIRGSPQARDSYIKAERRGSTDPGSSQPLSPSVRSRTPTGFRSPGADSAISPMMSPASGRRSTTPTAAFRGSGGRDGYMKAAQRQSIDVSYSVPGMAEEVLLSPKGKIRGTPSPRDSYVKGFKKGCGADVSYDVPGMADSIQKSSSGSYAFKAGPSDRDSHIKAEKRGKAGADVTYTLSGSFSSPTSAK